MMKYFSKHDRVALAPELSVSPAPNSLKVPFYDSPRKTDLNIRIPAAFPWPGGVKRRSKTGTI